jgi:hypothetical protein
MMCRRRALRSNRARVAECPREQRTARVEDDRELLGGGFSLATPVVELPTLGQAQPFDVTLAQVAGAGTAFDGRVEPHDQLVGIEREGGLGYRVAAEPRTTPLHAQNVAPAHGSFAARSLTGPRHVRCGRTREDATVTTKTTQ